MKAREGRFVALTGCCPNRNSFERALKRFLPTNVGEVEDQRCQLFEPEGRVLEHAVPGFRRNDGVVNVVVGLDVSKIGSELREKTFGQQPAKGLTFLMFYGINWVDRPKLVASASFTSLPG